MTIAAGFKTRDGIIICADSEENLNDISKRSVPKLKWCPRLVVAAENNDPSNLPAIAFCGAGDGPFIDMLVQQAMQAGEEGKSLQETAERIESAIKAVYKEYGGIYQPQCCPEVQLIYGIVQDGLSGLFTADGPVVNEVHTYATRGIGRHLADFLASRMYRNRLTLRQLLIVAVYSLYEAKQHVPGCGGESQVAVIRESGDGGIVDSSMIEIMESLVGSVDKATAEAFVELLESTHGEREAWISLRWNLEKAKEHSERTASSERDRVANEMNMWGSKPFELDEFGIRVPKARQLEESETPDEPDRQ